MGKDTTQDHGLLAAEPRFAIWSGARAGEGVLPQQTLTQLLGIPRRCV